MVPDNSSNDEEHEAKGPEDLGGGSSIDQFDSLPVTPLRRNKSSTGSTDIAVVNAGGSVKQSPMERMRGIEIERLKSEVNERAEEVERMEGIVEGFKREVAGYVGKVSGLLRVFRDLVLGLRRSDLRLMS